MKISELVIMEAELREALDMKALIPIVRRVLKSGDFVNNDLKMKGATEADLREVFKSEGIKGVPTGVTFQMGMRKAGLYVGSMRGQRDGRGKPVTFFYLDARKDS